MLSFPSTSSLSAPKAWKRPATRIYNDNYRFGNSLYSGAVADLDKKPDRPISSIIRPYSPPAVEDRGVRRAVLEADLGIANYSNSELHRSLSAQRLNELGLTAHYKPVQREERSSAFETTTSSTRLETSSTRAAADTTTFSTYASAKALANVEAELEESRARRRRQRAALYRPESYYDTEVAPLTSEPEPIKESPFWMERWYSKSLRSVTRNYFPI